MRHLGTTPPFKTADGKRIAGSIAEVRYMQIGGADQWVMIRGESVANPILIMLHGGPGLGETGFFRHYNAALEKIFTVVYWDQRGAGKSYDRSLPRSSMTLDQFMADLTELVDAVCKRLHKTKVVLFGHSWGSVLGVLFAACYPEKVAAYVGSGQIGDWAAAESASYAFALAEARRRGDKKAEKKLVEMGAPPYSAKSLLVERTLVSRFEGRMRPRALWEVARATFGGRESSIFDLPATYRGFRWTLDAMWSDISTIDLNKLAPTLDVPVFFFLGRQDHWVPPETSVAYFDKLVAPSKQLVWFERSGHEPFMDEPEKFNQAMADLVRPIVPSEIPLGRSEGVQPVAHT